MILHYCGADFTDRKGLKKLREEVRGQKSGFPISASQHFRVSAFAFASQLWLEDLTAKLFCRVEFWMERLPKLIGLFQGAAIAIRNSELQEKYTISHP